MLRFWELAPSPNSTKVRMALRFKGIDFETIPVDMMERSAVLKASGQELAPVIADKGIVLNDSEAILFYLDANYRDTPRLYPSDRQGRYACDGWKTTLDERVGKAWAPVFMHALGFGADPGPEGAKGFQAALAWLEGELSERQHLAAAESPVSELRIAQWATYALPGPGLVKRIPLFQKLKEAYAVPAGRFKKLEALVAPWNDRLA